MPVSAISEDSENGIVNQIVSDMIPINPIELKGPWAAGFALDIHTISSQYLGDDAFGHAQFDTKRSAVGELLYQLKSHGDKSGIDALCDVAHSFVVGKGWKVDVIVSVPPSRPGRRLQPVPLLADGLAKGLGIPVCDDCIKKTKLTPEMKTVYDYQKRLDQLRDAYAVNAAKTEGRVVLLVDDLYRSGATLEAVARALLGDGRAKSLFALAFTRTRSHR